MDENGKHNIRNDLRVIILDLGQRCVWSLSKSNYVKISRLNSRPMSPFQDIIPLVVLLESIVLWVY